MCFSRGGGVADPAHEEDALGGVLHDEDQEGPVDVHGVREAHGHDLNGGGGGGLGPLLVHAQHDLVRDLRRTREGCSSLCFYIFIVNPSSDNKVSISFFLNFKLHFTINVKIGGIHECNHTFFYTPCANDTPPFIAYINSSSRK